MNERIKKLAEDAKPRATCGNVIRGLNSEYHDAWMEKFAELLIREYSYDVMNLHGAQAERVQYAAKCWGVEV